MLFATYRGAIGLGIPVLIGPGEIIAFSAQHAHATVHNLTDLTRISMDTRTLRIPDHLAGRGARNVDGRARWTTRGMFKRLSDNRPLTEVLRIQALQRFEPRAIGRMTNAIDS